MQYLDVGMHITIIYKTYKENLSQKKNYSGK